MTNSKHLPKRRFSGFEGEWEQKQLDELSTHRSGTAIENYFSKNGLYKVISIGSYGLDGNYIDQGIRAISNEITDNQVVKKNELTMVLNDKTSNGTIIGRTLLIDSSDEFVVNQRTEIITPKNIFNPLFAFALLNGKFRDKVKKIVQGGTQIYVNYSSVKELQLHIPNLIEQKQLGILFQTIDRLITLHQHKLDKLKNLKKSYLAELFPAEGERVPKRRFPGFEGEWEEKKMEELGKVITGNTPSTSKVSYWSTSSKGHTWVTPTDINDVLISDSERYLSDLGWSTARTVPENSILITSIASIGKNTINTIPVAFNQQINAIVPQNHNSYFILSAMSRYEKQFKNLAGQTATPIINKLTFEKFEIPVPPIKEQEKIGEFFQKLDKSISLQQEKLDKLKDLKKAYLNELFV